ncbi:MAG: alpha/beta hydrolase [Pseudomonadota bacterium]
MPSFSSDGFPITYLDVAPSDTAPAARAFPILLIHGFASNHRVNWVDTAWTRTLAAAGYRVIAMDNRGHGQSGTSPDPADYAAKTMAEDARRLLDHLGISTAHVMGYSMGARISAFLAMAHGDRVSSVMFAGLGINMIKGLGGSDEIAAALEAPSAADVSVPWAKMFRVFAEQTKSDLPSLAACIRSSRDPISADAIATLRMPVLVAVGTDDTVAGSGPELAAIIPTARAFEIVGRDHMKAVGDQSYKDEVLAFLATVEAEAIGEATANDI